MSGTGRAGGEDGQKAVNGAAFRRRGEEGAPAAARGSVCVYGCVNTDVTARQPKTFLDEPRDEEKEMRRVDLGRKENVIFLGGVLICGCVAFTLSLCLSSLSLLISHPVVTDVC